MRRALPLLLVLVLAGCATPSPAPPGPGSGDAAGASPALVVHDSSGLLDAEGATLRLRAVNAYPVGAEPTIGATRDGTLFVAGAIGPDRQLPPLRSRDGGATWGPVGDPVRGPRVPSDPFLAVDPWTDRVYHGWLNLACDWLTWSDDGGETWDANPASGCGLPLIDHPKIAAGPPAQGVRTSGHPGVVMMVYNSLRPGTGGSVDGRFLVVGGDGTYATVSLDGGRTFGLPVKAYPADPCFSGVNGPVVIGAEGVAWFAKPTCKGVSVVRSGDSGQSWRVVGEVTDVGIVEAFAIDPALALDAAGNLHLAWPGKDGAAHLATSRDGGATWSRPVRASPSTVGAVAFPTITAGAEGRVAIAYLGTASDPRSWPRVDPSVAPDDTVWHLHVSVSMDALAPDPVFVTAQATPDDDPVQRGCIWLWGGATNEPDMCRNLFDFIGMTHHQGRVHVSYTDGCDRCASARESRGMGLWVASVMEGPSLVETPLVPLTG